MQKRNSSLGIQLLQINNLAHIRWTSCPPVPGGPAGSESPPPMVWLQEPPGTLAASRAAAREAVSLPNQEAAAREDGDGVLL